MMDSYDGFIDDYGGHGFNTQRRGQKIVCGGKIKCCGPSGQGIFRVANKYDVLTFLTKSCR